MAKESGNCDKQRKTTHNDSTTHLTDSITKMQTKKLKSD